MPSQGQSTRTPSSQQIQVTNDAITELNGLSRTAMGS